MLDGAVSLRVGQQAADLEFAVSEYAGVLINASFGWPTLAAVDLPSGGPAYPLATPGVRLRLEPRPEIAALLGVFSGDPAPAGSGDPQVRNASGTSFTFNRGVFVIGELQYRLNADEGAPGLPGTYKIGAWYNSNRFADQRFDVDGLSLADPASSGVPREHRGDWSVYAVADQLVWRKRGTKDQGIGIFARVVGARSDRNLVDFFVNAGATWKGAIPGREDDTAGIGVTYARTGSRARGLDRDVARFTGVPFPVRSSEAVLEVTYQAQVTSWLTLQPDFQYVFRPGGGIPDPNDPTGVIGDAAILGLRGVLVF
jgi:porin